MGLVGNAGVQKAQGFQLSGGVRLLSGTGAPTSGTSGTGATLAGPGSVYFRTSNGAIYSNTNTKASPTWTLLPAPAAASIGAGALDTTLADGFGFLWVARATFDAGVVGNRTVAAHTLGVTIPNKYIVVGGVVQVNTLFTSTNSTATIAISVQSANDIVAAAAVSGAPWSTTGLKAIVPKANTPETNGIALTADRLVTATVAVEALLTGKATVLLYAIPGA